MDKYVIPLLFSMLVAYFKPLLLIKFSNSGIGKIAFIILIVAATIKKKYLGLLPALLFIMLNECAIIEGLDDGDVSQEKKSTEESLESLYSSDSPDDEIFVNEPEDNDIEEDLETQDNDIFDNIEPRINTEDNLVRHNN